MRRFLASLIEFASIEFRDLFSEQVFAAFSIKQTKMWKTTTTERFSTDSLVQTAVARFFDVFFLVTKKSSSSNASTDSER